MAVVVVGTKRINVSLSKDVAADLEALVPKGERNRFIVEAVEKALRRARFLQALEISAGAWSDEDHPDLMTIEDVDRYVRNLRSTWMPRSWEEIGVEAREDERQPA